MFSEHLACMHCGLSFEELAPRNFSFNSPYGACETCDGLGTKFQVDPELVVPDDDLSIDDGAIAPWSGFRGEYFKRVLTAVGDEHGFSTTTPWKKLKAAQKKIVLYGAGAKQVTVRYKNRYGRQRSYATKYEGVVPWVERRHTESDSDRVRDVIEGYMRLVPCPACGGARLRPASLAVTIGGPQHLRGRRAVDHRLRSRSSRRSSCPERDRLIAERVFKEVLERLQFMLDVGLDYLSLNRASGTLAGGEAQRIRLASQIGSGLVGVLYVLDEPSIGLHQRDNRRLIETLMRLRNLGNTVIVVEHDEETIRVADHVVDIGPGAGEHGGEIIVSGTVKDVLKSKRSITGQYLSGKRKIDVPALRREPGDAWLAVRGARAQPQGDRRRDPARLLRRGHRRERQRQEHARRRHPAPGADAEDLPVARGARPAQADRGHRAPRQGHQHRPVADRAHAALEPGHLHRRVRQDPHAVREHARSEGARLPARPLLVQREGRPLRGVPGRRHDQDRDALPPRRVRAVRGVQGRALQPRHARHRVEGQEHRRRARHAGRGGARVLREPAVDRAPAADAGRRRPRLRAARSARAHAVGRRGAAVKLSTELGKRATGHTIYILDEPTTGLHFEDVRRLLGVLQRLVDTGNTMLVIEHNLDVIKSADWIVDLGPEGGAGGGIDRGRGHAGAGREGAGELHRPVPCAPPRHRPIGRMTSTAVICAGPRGPTTPPHPASAPGSAARSRRGPGLAALAALGTCAWLGVVKFDEGWYIVSARLAGHGALPYRDFAFTQGPLFAYVLAPSQWIAPGIVSAGLRRACARGRSGSSVS